MNADPELKDRLSDAVGDLPLDLERRLDAARTGSADPRSSRVPVYAVAAGVALVAVFAAFRLLPRGDERVPSQPGAPSGTILYSLGAEAGPADAPTFDYDVYALDLGTGESLPLVDVDGRALDAVPSPDGSRIAFIREGDVMLMNADGSDLHAVGSDASVFSLAWSPDGTRLAFIGPGDRGGSSVIRTISPDGIDERTYEYATASWDSLAWSPDGSRLVVSGYAEGMGEPGQTHLYVLQLEGNQPLVQLTDDLAGDGLPTWSPDGSTIVFMRQDYRGRGDYVSDIASIPAVGGPISLLTDSQGVDAFPRFSPDGRWIAFLSDREAAESQRRANARGPGSIIGGSLFVMAAGGGDVRLVFRTDDAAIPTGWATTSVVPLATPVPDV